VVPSARRTLAKEKRSGPLREYLETIQAEDGRGAERWFYTDWLKKLERQQGMARRAAAKRAAAAGGGAAVGGGESGNSSSSRDSGVVTTLAATESAAEAGGSADKQQQEPDGEAEWVDKEPDFFSLDNPLFATAALIAAFGLMSALVQQLVAGSGR